MIQLDHPVAVLRISESTGMIEVAISGIYIADSMSSMGIKVPRIMHRGTAFDCLPTDLVVPIVDPFNV